MPLSPPTRQRLAQALSQTPGASAEGIADAHTLLCRREAAAFQRAAKDGDDLVVCCTQESLLFAQLNEETVGAPKLAERPIRFVNVRETGGWSKDAAQATPKLAALIAAAQLPEPEPVAAVSYKSAGRCLVIGDAARAEAAAAMLGDGIDATLLIDRPGSALAQRHLHAVQTGQLTALTGWLGAFEATWSQTNPIDLDLCTRCNACIAVCPEQAIDFSYQIDLSRCKSHRDCVAACDAAGAIDFNRAPTSTTETFDLVLDLRAEPAFTQHAPPQGYFHVPPPSSPSPVHPDPSTGSGQGTPLRGVSKGERPTAVGLDTSAKPFDTSGRTADLALFNAVQSLRDAVGEFEKPKFFHYKQKLCAHSRNEQIGCTACIDVCSAQAIRSAASLKGRTSTEPRVRTTTAATPAAGGQGGGIIVEPHLCVGCGACTTVCPSGALAYATPTTVDQGKKLRTLLTAYRHAGGADAALLIHSQERGAALIDALGRQARVRADVHGVPERVLPLAVWHTASFGLDLWLAAIALGASQVWVLATDEEAPQYRTALREQMAVGQAILSGLGYSGEHLRLIEANEARPLDAALKAATAATVKTPATLAPQADKRATLDMAIDHLIAHSLWSASPSTNSGRTDVLALPAVGSPFGSLAIDKDKCTMCLSCVGACPEAALADNPDAPQLRFIEKNCVQCGVCVKTCPEDAITLEPRLWLADEGKARKQLRVLNTAQPFHCIKCAKPFGTLQAIEAMIGKIGHHPAFAGAAAERLKMCSDCRVVDMFSATNEQKITDL